MNKLDFMAHSISSMLSLVLLFVILLTSCATGVGGRISGYIPQEGYVPNEEIAIRIAETIWLPVYGSSIYEKKPFVARLEDGIWIVQGTVNAGRGGAPYIEIRKRDCKIMKMYHGK